MPKFQGKKNIFQLKQENPLLARMFNLNNFSLIIFPIFVQKQQRERCLELSFFNTIQIQYLRKLTQLEKYGKKPICTHVNLSVYSRQRRQKQKRQGNNSHITKIMKYNWRKTGSGNMFILNLTVNRIFVQSPLFKLRHLFTVAI